MYHYNDDDLDDSTDLTGLLDDDMDDSIEFFDYVAPEVHSTPDILIDTPQPTSPPAWPPLLPQEWGQIGTTFFGTLETLKNSDFADCGSGYIPPFLDVNAVVLNSGLYGNGGYLDLAVTFSFGKTEPKTTGGNGPGAFAAISQTVWRVDFYNFELDSSCTKNSINARSVNYKHLYPDVVYAATTTAEPLVLPYMVGFVCENGAKIKLYDTKNCFRIVLDRDRKETTTNTASTTRRALDALSNEDRRRKLGHMDRFGRIMQQCAPPKPPSPAPTLRPTSTPRPSRAPSRSPTQAPSVLPTRAPSGAPTVPATLASPTRPPTAHSPLITHAATTPAPTVGMSASSPAPSAAAVVSGAAAPATTSSPTSAGTTVAAAVVSPVVVSSLTDAGAAGVASSTVSSSSSTSTAASAIETSAAAAIDDLTSITTNPATIISTASAEAEAPMDDNIGSVDTVSSVKSSTASPATTTTSGGGEIDVTAGMAAELVSTPVDPSAADGADINGAIDTDRTSYTGDAVDMDTISAPVAEDDHAINDWVGMVKEENDVAEDDYGMNGWVEIVEEEDAVETPVTKMMQVDDDIEEQYVPSAAAQEQTNAAPKERQSWLNLAAGFGVLMGAIIGLVSWLRRKFTAFVGGVSQAMQAPAPAVETA